MIKLIITLLLPLLAVVWLMYVIKRKAKYQTPVDGIGAMLIYWIVGFLVTWLFATYLGLYMYGLATETGVGESAKILFVLSVYVGGLWGALLPYRAYARAKKDKVGIWLGSAFVYSVLFYLSTMFVR
ncbi:hypothetical protein CIG75_16350 [Tumebacillus algifaecis]|uniref:DUF1761 domain-containing protein n=1 Tax=Tumebacillus algifaecis TaxID=1214604 RepID=A0A223D4J3_9BACL|nr:hypothetical protein [Tumebacillus algifaecis]ASS76367.1 hypothetical protein CIG75_16350 [Tumebacillus algifaecis]